jgi:hypothetical protein
MGFFARPNLSDEQFKQLEGTTLTLSGQTKIENVTGFSISDGSNFIPVIVTGGTNFDVLTYCNGKITLEPSTGTGGGGVYSGASPTTCTVGGLCCGSPIYGLPISDILESILVPTVSPAVSAPGLSFYISPSTTYYEVGVSVSVTGCLNFTRGSIAPQYCGTCCFRSGLPNTHRYQDMNGGFCNCLLTTLTSTYAMPAHTITPGNNTSYGTVCYDAGPTPAYDSSGAVFCTALPAGCIAPIAQSVCGLYPYYYGKVASGGCPAGINRPIATCAMIIGGCKVVALSTSTLCINFSSSPDDYIWFATPDASATKTKWFVDALNNGNIGGAVSPGGNLFPSNTTVCPVSTVLWGGQCYKIYISNYQTASATIMELRNS